MKKAKASFHLNRTIFAGIASAAVLLTLAFCNFLKPSQDLDAVKKSGRLRVIMTYDPVNYFIYKGAPMGYSYELAQKFCDDLGVEMEVVLVRDLNRLLTSLRSGKGDIVAHNLTITAIRKLEVDFTEPISFTSQVLVQKKVPGMQPIRKIGELRGKTIHVRSGSAYYTQLQSLESTEKINLDILTVPGSKSTSELITEVANGRIAYTVADRNIADAHRSLYPDLDFATELSRNLPLAWAVPKQSSGLQRALNRWLKRESTQTYVRVLQDKYYRQQYTFKKRAMHAFYSGKAGEISIYDPLVKKYAKTIEWDWRLLASLLYEESHFDPQAVSWAGAMGLMQLMPGTARMFGISDLFDPETNIRAGTLYLAWLHKEWNDIADPENRIRFILASYNAGPGHVRDAQELARKYGRDPEVWEGSVERYMELKSDPFYYRDDVAEYGFCNGFMPVNYARNILARYEQYRQVIPH
ncbi:MAG: transporter substrate-binding domain-containing protein [Chlorobium sp.]|uniref:transglycosylase SLT domain-containing protein n=1 Tax=Chlorobium sp. TaxID=1095 RepID=UPI0025C3D973|nr:transporter substrate-binding domain-containing protein [Chlorobium sp.]MCF8382456.1 transporter substrate-binding domain-containing protein [Chlorobium sp.]